MLTIIACLLADSKMATQAEDVNNELFFSGEFASRMEMQPMNFAYYGTFKVVHFFELKSLHEQTFSEA